MLVAAQIKGPGGLWNLESSLEELAQLTRTAGAEVVTTVSQQIEKSMPYYLGKGKLEEMVDDESQKNQA